MAQATDDNPNINPSQAAQILAEIRELRQDVEHISQDVERISQDVERISQDVEQSNQNTNAFNQKFDTYQKATQWVVQLAFSLIAAATVTVIISTVLGK